MRTSASLPAAAAASPTSVDLALYEAIRDEELETLGGRSVERFADAVELLDGLVSSKTFVEFLTLGAYERL